MIDLHSHVLPNIDDGAQSLPVALAMLDEYARMGYSTVVATPHWMYPNDEEHQARINSTYERLLPHAIERDIRLLLGRECMLPPDYLVVAGDRRLALNNGRFLLVELPFHARPLFLETTIFGLQAAGNVVILAHPERYRFLQQDKDLARTFADQGVLMQINLGSVSGTFGKSAKETAGYLLRNGFVHLAATDAHSNGGRMQAVPSSLKILKDLLGSSAYQCLVYDNPERVLADEIPEPVQLQSSSPSAVRRLFGRVFS